MRNIKLTASRWAAVLATAGLCAGAVALSASSAGAATNACSTSCVDIHFLQPGRHELVKDHSGLTKTNNVIALNQGSNSSAAEDFSEINVGTIDPIYCNGTGQAQAGSVFTNNQCHLLDSLGMGGDTTFQLAFNPNDGGPETQCIGDWNNQTPVPSGWKARLEPCGVTSATVIIETAVLPGGATTAAGEWLISGGSNNFSTPQVLTVQNTTAWQAPTWSTVNLNGQSGQDTQEVRITSGPYTV
jgi:hypothetical protein